jgi:hypothetical protein
MRPFSWATFEARRFRRDRRSLAVFLQADQATSAALRIALLSDSPDHGTSDRDLKSEQ